MEYKGLNNSILLGTVCIWEWRELNKLVCKMIHEKQLVTKFLKLAIRKLELQEEVSNA